MARIDKLTVEEKEIIWSDRKRYLGMPLSFTKYSLDEDRLYIKTGLLRSETDETLLYRIIDLKHTQTLGQKLFGVGTVKIYCVDQTNPEITLKNIKNAKKLHRYLSNLVEEIREEKGIAGREMFGAAAAIDDGCDCDCHNGN